VQRLDSIEIEPFMVAAARQGYFERIRNVFEDPRSHIIFDDAKTFLASAHQPYDLIVSEPSNPWVSGVATLFSDEFYGRIAQYLTPDGYFAQWMQVYETNTNIVASVIKALAPHFGAYALYNVDDVDMLIIATRAPRLRAPDEALLRSKLLQSELSRVSIQSVADFQSRQMGDNHTIGPVLTSMAAPANSDFYPYIDLNAPRSRYLRETAIDLPALTVLPIPFFELLGAPAAKGPTVEPAAGSALFRDGLVRRALQIRDAAASGDLNGLDPIAARFLSHIDISRERCAGESAQQDWQDAAKGISDTTAAYLAADELQPIWLRIRSSPCYQEANSVRRAWADLWAAIAQRDAARIAQLGTGLLASPDVDLEDDLTYLTVVSAAARIRAGDRGAARQLLDTQWPRIHHDGKFAFALLDLRAIAATP
jgi:hypothetical protein